MTQPAPLPPELLEVLFHGRLTAVIRRTLRGCQPADIEDAVQNAHLALLERWQSLARNAPATETVEGLIRCVLACLCKEAHYGAFGRKEQRRTRSVVSCDPSELAETTPQRSSVEGSPWASAAWQEQFDRIDSRLSSEDRLLLARLAQGERPIDISRDLGRNENYVNVRRWRIKSAGDEFAELQDLKDRAHAGTLGGGVTTIPVHIAATSEADTPLEVPVSAIAWQRDGMLTAHLELPPAWPALRLGIAILATPNHVRLVSAPFLLVRDPSQPITLLSAFLGSPDQGAGRALPVGASMLWLGFEA